MSKETMVDGSYQSNKDGGPTATGRYVTFIALPCPLPSDWATEFKETKGNIKNILVLEKRARALIGKKTIRKLIEPRV